VQPAVVLLPCGYLAAVCLLPKPTIDLRDYVTHITTMRRKTFRGNDSCQLGVAVLPATCRGGSLEVYDAPNRARQVVRCPPSIHPDNLSSAVPAPSSLPAERVGAFWRFLPTNAGRSPWVTLRREAKARGARATACTPPYLCLSCPQLTPESRCSASRLAWRPVRRPPVVAGTL
jgi:hypothetical protein